MKLCLIDTPGFIFRAYHALPPLTNSKGVSTGAVFGFANMLLRLFDTYHPDYIGAIFDAGRESFRNDIYPAYKAHRPPTPPDLISQFELVQRLLDACAITSVAQVGFEADDLIATYARLANEQGLDVTIVSSDKDLMQLVQPNVALLDTMRNKRFDAEAVRQKFGVPPEQLGDWLALVGDTADNVPGVPGVGPKTATKLLEQFGSVDGILSNVAQIKGDKLQKSLQDAAPQLRISRRLVALDDHCPLPYSLEQLHRHPVNRTALASLLSELEFNKLEHRLIAMGNNGEDGGHVEGAQSSTWPCLTTRDALTQWTRQVANHIDVLSIASQSNEIGVCWSDSKVADNGSGDNALRFVPTPGQLEQDEIYRSLAAILAAPNRRLRAHDSKRLQHEFALRELSITCGIDDTLLAAYVLDPSQADPSVAELSQRYGVSGQQTRDVADTAHAIFALGKSLTAKIAADVGLSTVYQKIELPLSHVLFDMERVGCAIDVACLQAMSIEVGHDAARLERQICELAGWEININSPKQLQKLLFEQLGLNPGKKTKTGFSTDAEVLSDLADAHPVVPLIEEYRGLTKLKSTYIDALPALIDPRTKRLHTTYHQAVAATGRLSSADPNLQNIPIRTPLGRKIRQAFIAAPDCVLVSADYSQVELRILAHISGDAVLIDAFVRGQDVHQRTASEVFNVAPQLVTEDERRIAKAVNFGVVYGQGDFGLSRQLKIPRAQAAKYIAEYFKRHSGVKAYMDQTIEQARADKAVYTLLGRRRPLIEIDADNRNVRQYAERIARNTPIQGAAADILKLAMIRLHDALLRQYPKATMILTVHDELVLEVPQDQGRAVGELVRDVMEHAFELSVPLKVDVGIGPNWNDLEELQ